MEAVQDQLEGQAKFLLGQGAARRPGVHYTLDESRSTEVAIRLLGSYCGVVLCDGYAVYSSLAKTHPSLESKVLGKPPDDVITWRQRKTRKLLKAIFRWIDSLHIPASSDLRIALRYIQLREKPSMPFLSRPYCARRQ